MFMILITAIILIQSQITQGIINSGKSLQADDATKTMSAMVSKFLPNLLSVPSLRAIVPSIISVNPASI